MRKFRIYLCNGHTIEISADFITQAPKWIRFWIKAERWYQRKRCVGTADSACVVSIYRVEIQKTSSELAKELGVKL